MLLEIAGVLSPADVQRFRSKLENSKWLDGNAPDSPEARQLSAQIVEALGANQLFTSAALPRKIFPPEFNRYGEGKSFANHVDSAFRLHAASGLRLRTDIACTLFLSEPTNYDGGELLIEDTFGLKRVKLEAGSLVLYPSSSLHRVEPITRGTRLASFFWVESLVREDARRSVLFDLDTAIARLKGERRNEAELVTLTGVYNNLLRMWGEP